MSNKRIFVTYLVAFILIAVCLFLLLGNMIRSVNDSMETYDRITTVYADSKIDFVIPSPTMAQLDEMMATEHVNSVFACYSIYSTLSIKNVDKSAYVLLLDDINSLDSTMFKTSRLMASNGEFKSDSLLVDEVYANQNNLSLGDKVAWKINKTESVMLTVDGIYYKNELDDVQVVVFNSGEQKEIIDRLTMDRPLAISSAYIDSSNIEQTKAMLRLYKPLGLLKTPDDFELYADYEEYIERFYQTDYFPQIIQVENYVIENEGTADMYKKSAEKMNIWMIILCFVIPAAMSAVIYAACGLARYAIRQIRDGISKVKVYAGVVIGGIAVMCGVALCGFLSGHIFSVRGDAIAWLITLIPAVAVAISLVAHVLIINNATKVQKK